MRLIGRDHPAGVLRAEVDRATRSHGGLVLVTGEPGIGKTTLVTGAAEQARRLGALVLAGSCWDSDSAPGYWPWVQVVRALRRAATDEEWAAVDQGLLAVLLGEAPGEQPPEGFPLYDAVTTALVAVSHHRPVVVVLEDLHWADPASLRLLEFAARHTWFERLLLIGTYRDAEVDAEVDAGAGSGVTAAEHPVRPLLTPLLGRAATLALTGLDPAGVGELMTRTAGREPDPDLVAEVHRRTGGNPFFVEQTARLWHGGGPVTAVAPGVRDAVRRRLSLLPGPLGELLASAAVLGREFDRRVLAATAARPVPEVDRLLEQAVRARLVHGLGGGRFAFAHDLVREALYDALPDADERHAAVVRALEGDLAARSLPTGLTLHTDLTRPADPPRPGDLSPPGEPTRPGDLARPTDPTGPTNLARPGDPTRPTPLSRPGDPTRPIHRVLPTHRVLPADLARHAYLAGDRLPADRVVAVIVAAARDAGSRLAVEEAVGHYRRAMERARGPLRRIAVAVELGHELCHSADHTTAHHVFDEAAALARSLADPEPLVRVALACFRFSDQEGPGGRLLREAYGRFIGPPPDVPVEELARRMGLRAMEVAADDAALTSGLWAAHDTSAGIADAERRLELIDELITVARRSGDHDTEQFAASMRWVALVELGDPRYLDQLHSFVALAERLGTTRFGFSAAADQSIICTLHGRYAEAEALLSRAADLGARVHAAFSMVYLHLRWALLLPQGRFAELEQLAEELAASTHPAVGLLLGLTALERGDVESARAHLDVPVPDERYQPTFEPLRLRFLAQFAAAAGDRELAGRVRGLLAPHRGKWLVSLYGCDISGPVDLWLGVVDLVLGRCDEAEAELTAARRSAERLRARPWAALADRHLAAVARVRSGRAPAVVPTLARRADTDPADEFRRDGEVWSLTFGGVTVRVPDSKGLRDLHVLLSSPGEPVPAMTLLAPGAVAFARLGSDPVLDDEAKARYRRRLALLDEEIDRAPDDERAAALDRERAALLEELRAAAGLAGRTRRLGDEVERARKTVTARIRDALRKLDARHPGLAAHLRETVSTGATCVYSGRSHFRL
ncbi:ATP-binding protein [Saccharothrix lopnurensis]|uniref:ATP-binding protein n=1 Tax=Saccharothrix lopnurensis TaxID=1670621 RepID=A0ABW1P7C0_9PSEU